MMKAELGLIDTTAGSITVLGKPAGVMNQHIGYVPQSYAVDIESNLTAEQSVLLGLTGTRFGIHPVTRAQREKARKAMESSVFSTRPHTGFPNCRVDCANVRPSPRHW